MAKKYPEELVDKLIEALENANGFLDTPVQRRKNGQSVWYSETLKSVQEAISLAYDAKF